MKDAIKAMGALAHEGRLTVFRLLVQAGQQGLSAGDIALATGYVPQTLSGYYTTLTQAGLLISRREGRSILYRADRERLADMLGFLLEDCCGGKPELCQLVEIVMPICGPAARESQ